MQDSSKKTLTLGDAILISIMVIVLIAVSQQREEHKSQQDQIDHQIKVVEQLDAITNELSGQLAEQYTKPEADEDWNTLFESNSELDGLEEILE